jgi:SpoVK/Ycf46/Vps4 family AAA+-type ATPase
LINFLEGKDVKKTEIYSQLKVSVEEAKILQYLTRSHVKGSEENSVFLTLTKLYDEENYEYIKKLPLVKNLLDLGWITQSSFAQMKIGEVSNLDLINSSVTLSTTFEKLLELGTLDTPLPEATGYNDHLEYLKDQFLRIDLYQKISLIRHNQSSNPGSIERIQKRLTDFEERLDIRLTATKTDIAAEVLFEENELNEKEQIIFLALLKEEYSSELESLREMNTLINLVSENDYDKIKNRSLLEDGSTLVEKDIIDYDEMLTTFGGVTRSFFVNEEYLQNIIHPNKRKKVKRIKLDTLVKEQDIFELITPKYDLDDVVLNKKAKDVLDTILKQTDKEVVKRLKEWGVQDKKTSLEARIIFYGPPGTGKTMTALSFAKTLKRKVLSFDCSKILSMYVGESEKNVRKIFDEYKELAKKTRTQPVLLLNEADQFLSSRTTGSGGGADKMHNQMQNIFLEQIERFDGILIATTNLLETIDPAFSRRFNYKLEFAKPNLEQRVLLWEKMLPKYAQYEKSFDIKELAKAELSGGQIEVVIKNAALSIAVKDDPIFTVEEFKRSISREISGAFGESKIMGFSL